METLISAKDTAYAWEQAKGPRIINIGPKEDGFKENLTARLCIAFQRQNDRNERIRAETFVKIDEEDEDDADDIPKEIAYAIAMEFWNKVSVDSYQSGHEEKIIELSVKKIIEQFPKGAIIIDLGAANSNKYKKYVKAFKEQEILGNCIYVPLDLNKDAVETQLEGGEKEGVFSVGLLGTFKDGDDFYENIHHEVFEKDSKDPTKKTPVQIPRLFLSLGSIFYNATKSMCRDRIKEFVGHLRPDDRFIVGQDSCPSSKPEEDPYHTDEYREFFTEYLKGINDYAGITSSSHIGDLWEWKSIYTDDNKEHHFVVKAKKEMVCNELEGVDGKAITLSEGYEYIMFRSWKRDEEEIRKMTTDAGLEIQTLPKWGESSMRQYLISPRQVAATV